MVVAALASLLWAIPPQPPSSPPSQPISRAELVAAMRLVADREPRFEITATTNGSRFQGEVILHLAREAQKRNPAGPALFIDHKDSFDSYLEVAGLRPEQAPIFARKAYEHKQAQLIEYRQDVVGASVDVGPPLELAVTVKASWPETRGVPSSYSYEDTYSDPNLRVTNQRVVSYKLLKFKDFILYDQVSGVSGRPTTGFFSVFLGFFGDGSVKQSRSAITADGLQIVRTRAQLWGLSKTVIVTIQKNGRAAEGIDRTRGDIRAIETTLKRELRIRYRQE